MTLKNTQDRHQGRQQDRQENMRGRQADFPYRIGLRGWWDILCRMFWNIGELNMTILAAGAAFYLLLAMFPALAAIVTTYALMADPQTVTQHLMEAQSFLPADVMDIFNDQLTTLSSQAPKGLNMSLVIGLLFAIWSAHKGVDALARAIGVAYKEPETRGFFHFNLMTYLMTAAAVILAVIILVLLVVLPSITAFLSLPDWWYTFVPVVRWIIFVAVVSMAIAILYRFAPARRPAKWRWLSTGAIMATFLWLAGSALFSYFVSSFSNYNQTYGALSAIIVLLLWLYISSFSIILGASLNAEMEHQTRRDTTRGPALPYGERGAVVADTLGNSSSSPRTHSPEVSHGK